MSHFPPELPHGPEQVPPPRQQGPLVPGQYPPGSYGQFWQPAPQPARRGGTIIVIITTVFAFLAAVCLFGTVIAWHRVNVCNSGGGQIAQLFDQQVSGDCTEVTVLRDALAVATLIFAVGCLAGIIDYVRR